MKDFLLRRNVYDSGSSEIDINLYMTVPIVLIIVVNLDTLNQIARV